MRIAIVAVFGLLASVVTSQFALAQTTDCAGISKREQLIRLKAASNYALLPVIYPDNSVHEVVLYGAAAPYVLTQVGVLSSPLFSPPDGFSD